MRVGKLSKIPQKGWNRKQGRGNKDFKKGGKLVQGVDALKKGGGGLEPSYEQCTYFFLFPFYYLFDFNFIFVFIYFYLLLFFVAYILRLLSFCFFIVVNL